MNPADLPEFGCRLDGDGAHFTVWGGEAEALWLCLFDGEQESARLPMQSSGNGIFRLFVSDIAPGVRYGLRAHGRYDPGAGYWYDPAKLLLRMEQELTCLNWPDAISGVSMRLEPGELPALQLSLFSSGEEATPDAAELVARLQTRHGGIFFQGQVMEETHPVPERRSRSVALP